MPDHNTDPADLNRITIRVLVVDDDETHGQAVADSLRRMNCECTVAKTGQRGLELIESDQFDIVVTDLRMGDVDGLDILEKSKKELPEAEVIILTGHGTINSAVAAMQGGAYTYLTKPLDINELRTAVEKASSRVRLIKRNADLRSRLDEKFGFEGVIGSSSPMRNIIEKLKHVAPTDATVLIQGENGTGKELVARALHENSPRKNKPFVPLNISALPDSILESELFGHEAGAFTGAITRRIGKFEYANGGTLFLDEVGEMPMDTQIKLLRVLEDRKITRIGQNEEKAVNVRLVAATNAPLAQMVEEGKFRKDLYYRLKVVDINLPPLRERRDDITLLMDHFLKDFTRIYNKEVVGISRSARLALRQYDWPGNIRELRNVMERMLLLDTDGILDVNDLPDEISPLPADAEEQLANSASGGQDALIGKDLREVEKYYIRKALEITDGKREEAANMLGMGERTLYRKIKEYDLKS
jgi:two-component system response regulator HydG